jgi:hypothetical protein
LRRRFDAPFRAICANTWAEKNYANSGITKWHQQIVCHAADTCKESPSHPATRNFAISVNRLRTVVETGTVVEKESHSHRRRFIG